MKRILFVGAPIGPLTSSFTDWPSHFGYNLGNLLIGQSIKEILRFDHYLYRPSLSPKQIKEECDIIVIAAANFITSNSDFGFLGSLASLIEECDLPCAVFGLGAQAPSTTHPISDLAEGTKRFLKAISDRSKNVGVRGYYTAEILAKFGVKNTVPLGCPSMFRSLTKNLHITKKTDITNLNVSLNGSRNVYTHSSDPERAKSVETILLNLSATRGFEYVLQNEQPEIEILCNIEDDIPLNNTRLTHLAKTLSLSVDGSEYRSLITKKFRAFFSLVDWDAYIKTKDFSLGSRFHGNVMALTNGVPAVIITHDSRTLEMCELFDIPHIRIEDVVDLEPMDIYAASDYSKFENRYRQLYDSFVLFLNEAGLTHNLG